jgi:hypothetical protein
MNKKVQKLDLPGAAREPRCTLHARVALLPHVSVGAEGQLGGFSLRCDDDAFDVARGQALKCDLAAVGVDCVTMWRGYEGGAQSGAGTGGAASGTNTAAAAEAPAGM